MSKKAISPLFAVVLIIGFSVVLGFIMVNWGSDLTRMIQSTTEKTAMKEIIGSTDVKLDIKHGEVVDDKINLLIENYGSRKIEGLNVRIYGLDGVENKDISSPLDAFNIQSFEITFNPDQTGPVEEVEVFPTVIVEGETVVYSNIYDRIKFDVSGSGGTTDTYFAEAEDLTLTDYSSFPSCTCSSPSGGRCARHSGYPGTEGFVALDSFPVSSGEYTLTLKYCDENDEFIGADEYTLYINDAPVHTWQSSMANGANEWVLEVLTLDVNNGDEVKVGATHSSMFTRCNIDTINFEGTG